QAKMIRRECCIFMATILSGRNWAGQAQNAAKANVRRLYAPAGCTKPEFKMVPCKVSSRFGELAWEQNKKPPRGESVTADCEMLLVLLIIVDHLRRGFG